MSDEREVFPILENSATEAGEVLHLAVEGETTANKKAMSAFAFKDKDGNFIHPQLNNENVLPVSLDSGTTKRARNKVNGNAAMTLIVELDLLLEKVYTKISAIMSSTRTSIYEIRMVDDADGVPIETVIGDAVTGSGQFTFNWSHDVDEVSTVGNTGTQKIRVYGMNNSAISDLRASVSVNEIA